jgi:aldose 1-epimerase
LAVRNKLLVMLRCLCLALLIAMMTLGQDAPVGKPFGQLPDGRKVDVYSLKNKNGVEVGIMTYGATIIYIKTPDRNGQFADITHGFDTLNEYLAGHPFFGATVGRYGNRIAAAKFSLDGKTYTLAANNGANSLHGGNFGFDKKLWQAPETNADNKQQSVTMTMSSPDGDEGYPGKLDVKVMFSLNNKNELKIEYFAKTDKATPVNLTNHTYFNLRADGTILDHRLKLFADRYTPVDAGLIPTGDLPSVKGTPFDFTRGKTIGAEIDANHPQVKLGGGYDHNFVLMGKGLKPVAEVFEETSGRMLRVRSTEPGVQFYTGNFLDGSLKGKGRVFSKRTAFCLETQHFPDSPNQSQFPSTILRPGEEYRSTTVWQFSAK